MNAVSQALSAALLHFVWQGTAVALLVWIALLLLRNRAPGARYAASCAALALMAALPAATIWILFERPVALSGSIAFIIPPARSVISASPAEWLALARQWILPVWAFGVAVFAIRFALAWRHVAALRRVADRAESALADAVSGLARRMSVTRPVRVLVSRLAEAPSVVGWLRPAILMPAAALAGLDAAQLQAILAHELAHIRRHDYLVNMLQTIVETLLFYHPAVWWVSARMRHERELCCDDLAVRHCGDAIGYARALTRLERIRAVPEPAVAANGGSLLYRIQRLTGTARECGPSRLPAVLALIAVAVCIPLTMHRAHARPEQAAARDALESAAAHDQAPIVQQKAIESQSTQSPVRAPSIEYPRGAREKGITGTVAVEATLDAAGNVADARVISGPVELRKAALRSVLEWQFGNATAGEVRQVSIDFKPDGVSSPQAEGLRSAEAVRARQMALTLSFLNDELQEAQEKLRERLADAAPQPEIEERLKDQIIELERKAAAAQQANMFAEDELAAWRRDLDRHLDEVNLAVSAADRNANRDRLTTGAMNTQLDALQRELAGMQRIYGPNHPDIRNLKAKIAELQQTIVKFVAGRKLVRIDGDQLPSGFQLPAQVGDTLTEDSMNAIVSAVNALDPNLEAVFFPVNEREVAIRIVRRQ
jgi:TonB family protein